MKNLFFDQNKVLENQDVRAQNIYDLVEKLIKQAKIYPNRAVVVFIVSIISNCLAGTVIVPYWY